MIKVNIKQLESSAVVKKVTHKVVSVVHSSPPDKPVASAPPPKPDSIEEPVIRPGRLNPLWDEFTKVKVARAKLSNKIFEMVESGASKRELKALVASIKDYQPKLEELYDQARHVDRYGKFPAVATPQPSVSEDDLFNLKDLKRKLIDKKHKLSKKLHEGEEWMLTIDDNGELSLDEKKKAVERKGRKQTEWQQELEQVTAEYTFVDEKIKRLTGKL